MKTEQFDPFITRLKHGINLIEASAGTGKTYTITLLILRLIIEHGIPIEKLLVVTFTKAATEELKDRIRAKLAEAKRALSNSQASELNNSLRSWIQQHKLKATVINQRLDSALINIDQAGIFTIHGFCQRVLREYALTCGQLFDAELTEDMASLELACIHDFWRRNVQSREAWEVSILTQSYSTPEKLLDSLNWVADTTLIFPDNADLDIALSLLRQLSEYAKQQVNASINCIVHEFFGKTFTKKFQTDFKDAKPKLEQWLQGKDQFPGLNALSLLTYDGLMDGLDGTQFKTKGDIKSEERKTEYLESLKIDTQTFDKLTQQCKTLDILLRRNLLEFLRKELANQLDNQNLWSFDNLITHLANALNGEHASRLIGELRLRFQAALIDEFQDTDNHQWHIFSRIFAAESHYLFLVGDPKQAIYKFRGADIYSYLEAQSQAQHRYTLLNNWRSHPGLVSAVNLLFSRDKVFCLDDIRFNPSHAALSNQNGELRFQNKPCVPMQIWQLDKSDNEKGHWQANRNDAGKTLRYAVVNEIVELLAGDYTLVGQDFSSGKKISPQDIAILVRSNSQAMNYQAALHAAKVPAVLNSTESVFISTEALDLYILLEAVAHPSDIDRLSQALALSWFGFDGQNLRQLLNDDAALNQYWLRFQGYHQCWLEMGFMTMMQNVMIQEMITTKIAQSKNAERRLTNIQHLIELLQQAVLADHLGLNKTLNWLKRTIIKAKNNPKGGSEQQQLRLENDADAVTIITMHRAKGLEFPIVFCPNLCEPVRTKNSSDKWASCHLTEVNGRKNQLIVDLGTDQYEQHNQLHLHEEKAENIRLAYVALTRAKYRFYLPWADIRSKDKANDSALAWLLHVAKANFSELDFSSQQSALQNLAAQHSQVFSYRLIEVPERINLYQSKILTERKLMHKQRTRSLFSDWQMSSYTALSTLKSSKAPEIPEDKSNETEWLNLITEPIPLGAQTGNVIHELMEHISFAELDAEYDLSTLRDNICLRYGLKIAKPELIDALIKNTVNVPLSSNDSNFSLKNIKDNECMKEMPFYLSLPGLNTKAINKVLAKKPTFQPLNSKQISGYLTGFIDLICCYQGRYYVMDYKTNWLTDYAETSMISAMREHNYGLQYWLYSVVLHRYLQQRLPKYDFNRHFGGVRYLFVRGMDPDQPMRGVFADDLDLPTLNALSNLLTG